MQTELKTALGPDDPDDGDEGRRQRGIAIAVMEHNRIRPDRFGYKVPSQSGKWRPTWSTWSTARTAPARTSRSAAALASTSTPSKR